MVMRRKPVTPQYFATEDLKLGHIFYSAYIPYPGSYLAILESPIIGNYNETNTK